jgi:chaperone modulatory protein CbpM
MTIHVAEGVWVNTSDLCTFDHLLEVSGLTRADLLSLMEAGVIEPSEGSSGQQAQFSAGSIIAARTARRLRDDFELDTAGLALALTLLRRMDKLQSELDDLRARFLTAAQIDRSGDR